MSEHDPWVEYNALLDRCRFSRIYHQKRERFFDLADGWTKFIALVSGATASYKLAGDLPLMAFFLTLTSALSLVVGYAKKARNHADLAKAFNSLEAEVIEAGADLTEETARALNGKLVRCELNEPRSLGALVRISQNEVLRASARPTQPVTLWQWFWSHIWDFEMSTPPKPGIVRRAWKRWNSF